MSGVRTIADIRARCDVDPATGCWHWTGAMNVSGPVVWTFDERLGRKCSLGGARAVWQFLHGCQIPAGLFGYRACFVHDCLAPSHVAAGDQATIGRVLKRSGVRRGTHRAQRCANAAKARAAQGIVETPAEIVLALRALDPSVSHAAAGRMYGVDAHLASDIRRGRRRAMVGGLAA